MYSFQIRRYSPSVWSGLFRWGCMYNSRNAGHWVTNTHNSFQLQSLLQLCQVFSLKIWWPFLQCILAHIVKKAQCRSIVSFHFRFKAKLRQRSIKKRESGFRLNVARSQKVEFCQTTKNQDKSCTMCGSHQIIKSLPKPLNNRVIPQIRLENT